MFGQWWLCLHVIVGLHNVCMHACTVCVCMYVCVHACVHVYPHVCAHIFVCVCVHVCVGMHVCVCMCLSACLLTVWIISILVLLYSCGFVNTSVLLYKATRLFTSKLHGLHYPSAFINFRNWCFLNAQPWFLEIDIVCDYDISVDIFCDVGMRYNSSWTTGFIYWWWDSVARSWNYLNWWLLSSTAIIIMVIPYCTLIINSLSNSFLLHSSVKPLNTYLQKTVWFSLI